MTTPIQHLDDLLSLVAQADRAIMDIYSSQTIQVEHKQDNSPLTQADMASHSILVNGLQTLFPNIPVISEEGDQHANQTTVQTDRFWLVDPIDGTKEFIARNGQFTVCLALVEHGHPTFGIISAPALETTYYGGPSFGSFKITAKGTSEKLQIPTTKNHVLLASRSHSSPETSAYIEQHYADYSIEQIGSQLKLPYIAEGSAEVYPRLGTTMKIWDLAAGHAILEGAGGTVTRPDGQPIDYRRPDLLAGDFLAKG